MPVSIGEVNLHVGYRHDSLVYPGVEPAKPAPELLFFKSNPVQIERQRLTLAGKRCELLSREHLAITGLAEVAAALKLGVELQVNRIWLSVANEDAFPFEHDAAFRCRNFQRIQQVSCQSDLPRPLRQQGLKPGTPQGEAQTGQRGPEKDAPEERGCGRE